MSNRSFEQPCDRLPLSKHKFKDKVANASLMESSVNTESGVTIVVVGGSGDLARKKTYPSLFSLYGLDLLPTKFTIIGYARTKMTDEDFRKKASEKWVSKIKKFQSNLTFADPTKYSFKGFEEKRSKFLENCFYHEGEYNSEEVSPHLSILISSHLSPLAKKYKRISPNFPKASKNALKDLPIIESSTLQFLQLSSSKSEPQSNMPQWALYEISRFFFSVVFARFLNIFLLCKTKKNGWTRVIVEKPFGRDLESSNLLSAQLSALFSEDQIYRIDHYLGKVSILL